MVNNLQFILDTIQIERKLLIFQFKNVFYSNSIQFKLDVRVVGYAKRFIIIENRIFPGKASGTDLKCWRRTQRRAHTSLSKEKSLRKQEQYLEQAAAAAAAKAMHRKGIPQ